MLLPALTSLRSQGTLIIYVNYNYRLGLLGFPQRTEAAVKGRLNLGLRDQLTALEWVQKNIGVFGGDKTKICTLIAIRHSLNRLGQMTIFGESAGATMTNVLFFNPSISGMVRAAVNFLPVCIPQGVHSLSDLRV